jgi:predicted dehydrogenase
VARLKVLFCGLGSIGQRHARNLRHILGGDLELLAYRQRGGGPVLNADMTVRPGTTLEDAYELRAFTKLSDALGEQPDVVFVTNPNSLHLAVALEAAKAGCHLFIEKPIADEIDGVEELLRIVEQKGLVAFVAYQFRFHPGLRWVKELLESGRLGRLVSAHIVNGEYLPDWHPWEDYRETHPARRDLGGGCLRIQTHELDYALWFFGLPTQVFAVGGHLSDLDVDVDDSVNLLMRCEHNGRSLPVHLHLDYLQRPPQRICEVVGDAGKLKYDYYASEVEFFDLKSRTSETFRFDRFDRNEMFMDELRHFLACLNGQENPIVDLSEGLRSMRIAQAAYESLQGGHVVELARG